VLFNKSSKISFCGRGGLIYKGANQTYFVDSELLSGEPDVVIYWMRIQYDDAKDLPLTTDEKIRIADEVRTELALHGLSVELLPIR